MAVGFVPRSFTRALIGLKSTGVVDVLCEKLFKNPIPKTSESSDITFLFGTTAI